MPCARSAFLNIASAVKAIILLHGTEQHRKLDVDVVLPCLDLLLRATQALLAAPLNEKQWTQATLPSRNGGIGFGDPTVSAHAARLAMLVNTAETILDLGVNEVVLKAATEAAQLSYNTFWGLHNGLPAPAKDLQRELTAAVHDLRRAKLVAEATPEEAERLSSVMTPHAADWLLGGSPWFSLTPDEVRYAARWILGVPLHNNDYKCPFCGLDADAKGLHATACHATGATSSGHNVVKLVMGTIYRAAGATVDFEQSTPQNAQRRPADLLVRGISARPLAIDVTIWSRTVSNNDPLDKALEAKVMASAGDCRLAGWTFKVWAADVYGAIHPLARRMVSTLSGVLAKQRPLADLDFVPPRQLVWRGLSAAVVSRAASHHLRHAVALSAASVAEPVEDILGINNALPGVSGVFSNSAGAESDMDMVQGHGAAAGESEGGSALLGEPLGPGRPSDGCQDMAVALAGAGDRGEGPAALSIGHGAENLDGPPPAARYVHEPYGPPPGAAKMRL